MNILGLISQLIGIKTLRLTDNIVCVSLVNATMCLNSIGESNVSNLKNCTYVLPINQNENIPKIGPKIY